MPSSAWVRPATETARWKSSFEWSRNRPLAPDEVLAQGKSSMRMSSPSIRQAAVYLKESSPREEFEIRGLVVKLDRPEATTTGKVTILGRIDDLRRRVVVELKDSDYHKAVTAHAQNRFVRCSGSLLHEGRAFRLHKPYGFTVEDDDP